MSKYSPSAGLSDSWPALASRIGLLLLFAGTAGAQTLSIVSGNGQLICSSCPTRTFAFDPLVVIAKDARGNPVANVNVTWTANNPQGVDGHVSSATSTTGADGTTSNFFFMSAPIELLQAFVQSSVTAAIGQGSSVTFVETNSSGSTTTGINSIQSSLQSPTPGTMLTGAAGSVSSIPVQVSVASFSPGGPVPGIAVSVTSDPNYPATAACTGPVLTDAKGNAVCNLQFGNTTGQGKIKIHVGVNYDVYGPFSIQVNQGSGTPGNPPPGASSLVPSLSTISFVYPGATMQTVSVTSKAGSVNYTASVQASIAAINWLTVGTPSGPAVVSPQSSFQVTVNPQSLSTGNYSANVNLHPNDGSPDVLIPVNLQVNPGGSGNPTGPPSPLTVSPTSLSFVYPGATSQPVFVSTAGGSVTYTAAVQVSIAAVSWLSVGAPSPGTVSSSAPSSFQVNILPQNLLPGTYQANIAVHPNNGTADVVVPVQLTVQAGSPPNTLSASPATLNLNQVVGGGVLPAGSISILSSGTGVTFNTTASTPWLSVSPATGTTPGQVVVSVNPAGMQPGNYSGTVTISATGVSNGPLTVAVNLTVQPSQDLKLSTPALSFSSQAGSAAPPPQMVTASAFNGSVPFTVNTVVTSPPGGTWISVSPTGGTAGSSASNVSISVNPAGLPAGVYTAVVTFSSPTAVTKTQTVDVTYLITALPTPLATVVANAGNNVPGPVSAGEIISLYGNNLGPAAGVPTVAAGGFLPTTFSDVQVTFDNIPAPLLYVSATQINAVVPWAIAGRASTRLVISYKNTPSTAATLGVLDSTPGIFANSAGQGAIRNGDGSVNGPGSPAAKGDTIVIYATGGGISSPAGVDGKITPEDISQLTSPIQPVSVTIGGVPAQVRYAGSAPDFISGALQINVVVPDGAPSGSSVPVVLTIGTQDSQPATMVIQ
jgi:uncharacterized protein (TIGR03437 family)